MIMHQTASKKASLFILPQRSAVCQYSTSAKISVFKTGIFTYFCRIKFGEQKKSAIFGARSWLLVVGCWSPWYVGCWLLVCYVVGCWLLRFDTTYIHLTFQ